jgi:hypothetical protein
MSLLSQVEMSPFAILKNELRSKGDIEGDVTSDERTRVDAVGSNPASKGKDVETTGSSGVAESDQAANNPVVQTISGWWRGRADF